MVQAWQRVPSINISKANAMICDTGTLIYQRQSHPADEKSSLKYGRSNRKDTMSHDTHVTHVLVTRMYSIATVYAGNSEVGACVV